jgi:hypothetical protein
VKHTLRAYSTLSQIRRADISAVSHQVDNNFFISLDIDSKFQFFSDIPMASCILYTTSSSCKKRRGDARDIQRLKFSLITTICICLSGPFTQAKRNDSSLLVIMWQSEVIVWQYLIYRSDYQFCFHFQQAAIMFRYSLNIIYSWFHCPHRGGSIGSASSPELTVGTGAFLQAFSEPSPSFVPSLSVYSLDASSASRACTLGCRPDGLACTGSHRR